MTGCQAAQFSSPSGGWSFPKHKELLTDDFYEDDTHDENPYAKQPLSNDYDNYDQPTHRSTATGVLSSYKKQLNLTAEDIMKRDYMESKKALRANVAKQFDKADRANFTKNMVDRLRLGKSIGGIVEGAGEEYGNYKKFEGGRN